MLILQKGQTTANGIYWAVTTMTTVGYRDPQPTNTSTKILAELREVRARLDALEGRI